MRKDLEGKALETEVVAVEEAEAEAVMIHKHLGPLDDQWLCIQNQFIETIVSTYLEDTNFLCSCCNELWNHFDCKKTTFEERYYNNSWYLCNHNIRSVPHVADQSHETCLDCGQFHEQLTELCQQRLTAFHSLKKITPCFCKCYSSKQFRQYRMWLCRNTNKPTSWLCLYYSE